jgi:hypothetical protein
MVSWLASAGMASGRQCSTSAGLFVQLRSRLGQTLFVGQYGLMRGDGARCHRETVRCPLRALATAFPLLFLKAIEHI